LQVCWKVRVWDENGEVSDYSAPARFEIGLLDAGDWRARWIGAEPRTPATEELTPAHAEIAVERNGRRYWPAPHLRKAFSVRGPIKQAVLYVTARGLYEASINGQRVGTAELAPGWTDYQTRIQYQTYDVTGQLSMGDNAIGVILGDGWYCGYFGFSGKREMYGVGPELLLQMEIEYEDGSRETVASDDTWRWAYGSILSNDLLAGDQIDARRNLGAWSTAAYDDTSWRTVSVSAEKPGAVPLVAEPDLPVAVTEELAPKSITARGDGRFLVDMGQNMVGRVRLRAAGTAGAVVTLRHVEILSAEGEIYTDNLRAALQADEFTLSGGQDVFEPKFTFHGFRYVEVSGYPGELTSDAITGVVLESETETAGELETGHAMVNQLIKNIVWGQRGNFVSVPTDCPQRDERLGWMGDAQVFIRTATYNRNVAPFFTKWLTDVRDAQREDGIYTDVCPSKSFDGPGAPAWTDAGVICPWTTYLMYADRKILEDSYDSMARYVDALDRNNPDGIWRNGRNNDYGDWLSIEADTPKELLATAYFANDALLMSRIAAILGKENDSRRYAQLFDKIKTAFNCEYVSADDRIAGETQTVYLLALRMSLLDPALRPAAARRLVADIEAKNWHLSTGFIGVSYLCPILTEYGYADVAYRLLFNETFPSWGYSIAHGATTIWERWDGWTHEKGFQDRGMNSFNHYSLGSVGEWLYRSVAGIDVDPDQPGFKHIVMRPEPSRTLGFAKAAYQSPYGAIASHWRFDGDRWLWDVTVPANTTATVYLPTSDIGKVTESDKPVGTSDGISDMRHQGGRVAMTLAPGRYAFRVDGVEASASA
jgi:alpha-L-rhamnosidase